MKTLLLAFLSISFLTISCKKDEDPNDDNEPQTTVPEYYIVGKVDGNKIHADYTCEYTGCKEGSAYYSSFMGWIKMERSVAENDFRGWDILISEVDLDSWKLPDTLNLSSSFDDIQIEVSYYSSATESFSSDYNYATDGTSYGDDSFKLIVTSKQNDIIEGTFEGVLRNGSDISDTVSATEGKFKIKIYRQ